MKLYHLVLNLQLNRHSHSWKLWNTLSLSQEAFYDQPLTEFWVGEYPCLLLDANLSCFPKNQKRSTFTNTLVVESCLLLTTSISTVRGIFQMTKLLSKTSRNRHLTTKVCTVREGIILVFKSRLLYHTFLACVAFPFLIKLSLNPWAFSLLLFWFSPPTCCGDSEGVAEWGWVASWG